ncbi:hypothetical protein T4A_8629 [Trichinella pseudospiralis]|uniref:Uncharacterized protein n=1 Tax=Trichinella pseudospiralis TaxID=6337 RepID=A0A0V1F0C4_TRIPS|nr:hypothetical protein T4A_8629 [Trichinella pseudospiralis]KRZ45754.1 hypothetical protein T4C_6118 [Trichinella pseudospiralis]
MHPRCVKNFILSIFELPKISEDSEPTEATRGMLLHKYIVHRLFHSLAAFAFHHTRLDVAVLEPNRLTVCDRCSSNYGIFDALSNFFLLRYSNCPLLSISSKWRCIDPNGSLNTTTTTTTTKALIITNSLFVDVIGFIYVLNLSKISKLLSEWNTSSAQLSGIFMGGVGLEYFAKNE